MCFVHGPRLVILIHIFILKFALLVQISLLMAASSECFDARCLDAQQLVLLTRDTKALLLTSGRPVDILQLHDGSLLVSDNYAGAIYRITYKE